MKTKTYARLSLLVPFLIWCICLLLFILVNTFLPDYPSSSETSILSSVLGGLLLFYVIGIIFWLLPYLLISLVLFILSFKSRTEVLKYIFVLSPFAMAILIMAEVAFLSMSSGGSLLSLDAPSISGDSMATIALFATITLIWGYICVGIGFGLYKLLQHLQIIRDETDIEAIPEVVSQLEI